MKALSKHDFSRMTKNDLWYCNMNMIQSIIYIWRTNGSYRMMTESCLFYLQQKCMISFISYGYCSSCNEANIKYILNALE